MLAVTLHTQLQSAEIYPACMRLLGPDLAHSLGQSLSGKPGPGRWER